MASDEKGGGRPRYKYNFGVKALLQDGKTVDTYEDTKENIAELVHFVTQNSNYRYSELQNMDIRDFLKVFKFVEKDIKRRIEHSK